MTLISQVLRDLVVRRAGNRCEYCRLAQESQVGTFPVDHVMPLCLGGATTEMNLCLACPRCNALKWLFASAIDPLSGQSGPLFHPRLDDWTEHFDWFVEDPTIIKTLTPVGRATAALLELNSPQRLDIRRWLIVIGKHPPQ